MRKNAIARRFEYRKAKKKPKQLAAFGFPSFELNDGAKGAWPRFWVRCADAMWQSGNRLRHQGNGPALAI